MAKNSAYLILFTLIGIFITAIASPGFAAKEPFDQWLAKLKTEAREGGVSQTTLDSAFADVQLIEKVVKLDRKQPEVVQTFQEYMAQRLPQSLIDSGKAMLNENRTILEKVGQEFGVQPRFIVALKILDDNHIELADMKGSWAGAMGQSQFMPSSFVNFAVDYDEDGRRDIWTTKADVFASAANYLAKSGWQGDQTWGREVTLPKDFDLSLIDLKVAKPMAEWEALGVRKADGSALPSRQLMGSLVQPKGGNGQTFLIYDNYRTILKWNRSTYFAMSVGYLADLIGDG